VAEAEQPGRIKGEKPRGPGQRQPALVQALEQESDQRLEPRQAGCVGQHVGVGLALLRPADVIGRDDGYVAGGEVPPESLDLLARPDGRVALGAAAEPGGVLLAEHEVVDAGLHRARETLRAVGGAELVAAADGAVDHVGRAAGRGADLVDLRHGQRLGDRRPAAAVRPPVGDAAVADLRHEGPHHLVVLVVDARHEPVRSQRGEAGVEDVRRDAREAARIGAEGGELEGRRSGRHEVADAGRALGRIHGGVEREVHARLRSSRFDLAGEALGRRDQVAVVVGHVHDRGHAAGGRRARGPDEVLSRGRRAAVDLAVDGARQDKQFGPAMALARRRVAGPDALHPSVAGENVAALDHPVGQNDGADEDLVAHGGPSCRVAECLA
jgi:hypothetical protein